jgi:signal transduction histidine kinase
MDCDGEAIDVETVSRNQMEPVFAIAADGTVAFANERFYRISGLSPETVIGADYDRFGRIVEDGLDTLRTAVESVLADESAEERVELEMKHPEDAPVPRHLPAAARVTTLRSDGATIGALVSLRRIGTRKAYERQLEQQNERLEEFASIVAHDLRNPLSVAEGRLEIASEECDSAHLESVDDALDRMWNIIEDTLTLARQGHHVGEKERVRFPKFVRQCWGTVSTSEATLEVEDEMTIRADADRLRNLFENLFRNAVEHAGDEVTIHVGAIEDGFFLEDDGPGIPPADRARVFDLGYSTAADGTGYGLAIVKWITEAHGWEVAVADSDGGARFEFTGVDAVRE